MKQTLECSWEGRLSGDWRNRGIVSLGDAAALLRFRAKLEAGTPIVYGAIGGSITAGASASDKHGYAARFAARLAERGECRLINAGVGASDSLYGAFRVQRDILDGKPDLITIEFAVNDARNPDVEASYEWLVRQCVASSGRPLVVLVFTMFENGRNMQTAHIPIGRHYGLPMVSYRDAIYPEVRRGAVSWRDLSPDEVHPNDTGHHLIFELLKHGVLDAVLPESEMPFSEKLHASLHPKVRKYEEGRLSDADGMKVVRNEGWSKATHRGRDMGWQASEPGATLGVEFRGGLVALGCRQYAGDFGRVEVRVDGGDPKIVEGFFDGNAEDPPVPHWLGGHTPSTLLYDDLSEGLHLLELRLLEGKHARSNGHRFEFGYLMVGGAAEDQDGAQ